MKNFFFSLFLAVLTFFGASANSNIPVQTVRGTVSDKISGTSLPGASVILMNTNPLIGTTTDLDGKFKIQNVPVGRISVKISFLGYKEAVISNINLNTGKELVLEIQLEESLIQQQGIEVKATKDKSLTNNEMTTVSSRGFTVEETQRYAGSLNDVARMASNFAGMSGSNDARNDIIIRGNSPLGLLWRFEGVDIPNPNHYGSPTSTGGPVCMINNNLLANSDFLTGAFPADYGNAISGVFDLKMRNGNNEKHEFLGQIGFNGVEAGAEGPLSRKNGSSYLANYRYSTLSVMDKMGADLGTGTGIPYYQDGSFKINLPKTKIGSIAVFGLGGVSDIKIWDSKRDTTKEKVDYYAGEGYDLTNGASMFTGGIINTLPVSRNAFVKTIVSGSFHRFKTTVDSLEPVTNKKFLTYENDLVETGVALSTAYHHKISARQNIKAGVSVREMGFDLMEKMLFREDSSEALRPVSDFRGSSWLFQPYVQYQYKFNDRLTLNSGLHFQYFAFNKSSALEPRIGLKWEYASNRSVNFAYGLHSQLLPINIYFRQTRMADGSYKRLNEDLGMMKSHHFVAGHDWNLSEFTRFRAEAYYQYIFGAAGNKAASSYFSLLNEGANFGMSNPDTLKSTGTGSNYGVEFTVERFLNKGLYYLLTLSLYDSKYNGSDGVERNTAFNGNYVVNALVGKEFELGARKAGEKKARTTLAVDVKMNWSGGQRYIPFSTKPDPSTGYTTYLQEYDYSNAYKNRFRDYARADLKIMIRRNGKHLTQEFGVDIQNVTDARNVYTERFNKKTGEKSYVYQMGRLAIPQYRIIF